MRDFEKYAETHVPNLNSALAQKSKLDGKTVFILF